MEDNKVPHNNAINESTGTPPHCMPDEIPPYGMPEGVPPQGRPTVKQDGSRRRGLLGGNYQKDGTMPKDSRTMAPDFTKMTRMLFIINTSAIFVYVVTTFILYLVGYEKVTLLGFVGWSSVCLLALGIQILLKKLVPKNDFIQHIMPLLVLIVLCTACVGVYGNNFATAFCVPISLSVIYYSNLLVLSTEIVSAVAVVSIAFLRYCRGDENAFMFLPSAILVIIVSYFFSQAICKMMNEQRHKMVGVIVEAKKAQMESIEANKAKSVFLANMSHEIRTPINAVLGMNEMILREEHNPIIRDYAVNIYNAGNLLLSIINDVLDISKIESGRTEINPVTYDVSSLINDCYNMTIARAREKNLNLKVEFSEELPQLLFGDEVQIRQIIVNLLTNAIKYTDEGGVVFMVFGAAEKNGDNDFIMTISVRDTGIGISDENREKLFRHFTRFDMEHNRTIEGTGLGLTIVKRLVDLMHGEISVKSELGKGSEFTVKIPQKIIDASPTGHIEMNYSHSADYDYVHSFEAPDARILAVDDLPVNLMVITNMLKSTKIKIDTATSGAEALEKAHKNKYDLILMDHMMPKLDGVQTYRLLREDKESQSIDVPVIMLTANALSGVREKYIDDGFADYLSKPVRGEKLEAMIKKYLPENLVRKASEETEEEECSCKKSKLTPLIEALPEFNLNLALSYCCGDEDFLISILQIYAKSTRYEEMLEQFEKEDFENYRINAHSLKGTSLTIGLSGLSERARASEFAIKNGSIEFAKLNHEELMKMYKEALDKIREFLAGIQ